MTTGRQGGLASIRADVRLHAAASVDSHGRVSDRSRILLCDPEPQSAHALRAVLHGAGFEVDATHAAAAALSRAALSVPAAAIVELVLPDGDGVELCRGLREWSAMPVILLSAVCDEEDQVRAFEAGADDYISKPFRPRELVARVLAKLRRAGPAGEEPCVKLDGLEIDLAARAVRRDGEEIHLTPIEFRLLRVLTQHRGRMLTHTALLQQVWGPGYVDARQTLRAHIANLRRKIEPAAGGRLIWNDPGVGYRLAGWQPESATGKLAAERVIAREFGRGRFPLSDPGLAAWAGRAHRSVPDALYRRRVA